MIFPSYDVRFIAAADGIDSAHGDNMGLTAIFSTNGINIPHRRKQP